jgi:hypothetical protein
MSLLCTPLRSQQALQLFASRYHALSGHRPSVGYLGRCGTYGIADRGGKLVGGYVLNSRRPFRYVDKMPERPFVLSRLPEDALAELTCLWLEPTATPLRRAALYADMSLRFIGSGKRYLLSGTVQPRLRPILAQFFPYLLFQGSTEIDGRPCEGWLCYGTRWSVCRGVVRRFANCL